MDLADALVALARHIQLSDPESWARVPVDPIPRDGWGLKEVACWAVKRHDMDHPALRDLPWAAQCRARIRVARSKRRRRSGQTPSADGA